MISSVVSSDDRVRYYLVFAAVVIFLILPLWPVAILPWTDIGDHMARVYILHHFNDVPVFRQYYEIERLPLPNLAMDLILPPMLSFMSAYVAAKVFASISVVLFAVACHVFGRTVHGAPTWLAIPAAFFFYNSLMIMGYVNYMWGVAWFLLAAAAWLVFHRTHSVASGVLTCAAASVTYISHLTGFFYLGLFAGCMTAWSLLSSRRVTVWNAISFLPLLPGLAAYATLGSAKGDIQRIQWNPLIVKLAHSGLLIAGYSVWMDAIVICGLALVIVAVVRSGKWGGDRALLATGGVFLLAFCVFPYTIHTGGDADSRFILPGALLLLLSVTVSWGRRSSAQAVHAVARDSCRLPRADVSRADTPAANAPWASARRSYLTLLTVLAIRIVLMEGYWLSAERILTEQLAVVTQVGEQSRIYPMAFIPRGRTETKMLGALMHISGYAVIDRNAVSASTFAFAGQQPLQHRIPLPYVEVRPSTSLGEIPWKQVFDNYDYLWIYNGGPEFLAFLDQHAHLRAQSGVGRLYRLTAPDPAGHAAVIPGPAASGVFVPGKL